MTTKLRRRVLSVLFDPPRKGWVAVLVRAPDFHQLTPCWAPVSPVHVPQREFRSADDVIVNIPKGRTPTAFARKHVKVVEGCPQMRAHYGRWGAYVSNQPRHLLVIAQDHATLMQAVIEVNSYAQA